MVKVKGDYLKNANTRAFFFLECDKSMIPGIWKPPITWKGTVDGVEVEFTQISFGGSHEVNYNFKKFPNNLRISIPQIIKAIDKKMKVMD